DMYIRLAFHVRFLFMPVVVGHGRYSKSGKHKTNVMNRNNERVLPGIIERALALLPNDAASEAFRRRARMAVFSTVLRQRLATKDITLVRDYFFNTLRHYPWMISEPACIGSLYGIASLLARDSTAPISDVCEFWQELRVAAPAQRFRERLNRRRLMAGMIWRGTAISLWSTRAYALAAQAALRAALCDPVRMGRIILSKGRV
ncbi:MAG TPA: hypothetical protein VE131_01070, partial [Terriglobales bacterium]|nr:hypothetical protein [Terriglobales bacterium]